MKRFSLVRTGFNLVAVCLAIGGLAGCQSEEEIKRQKYFAAGQRVYVQNCANCHQRDGSGLEALYPPLKGADYLQNKEKVICLIRHGLNGPIVVNGKRYNRPMPANPQLADIDVATLTTYVYNQWGGEKVITDVKTVSRVLEGCEK